MVLISCSNSITSLLNLAPLLLAIFVKRAIDTVCGNQLSVILHLHRMYENVPPKNFSSHTVHWCHLCEPAHFQYLCIIYCYKITSLYCISPIKFHIINEHCLKYYCKADLLKNIARFTLCVWMKRYLPPNPKCLRKTKMFFRTDRQGISGSWIKWDLFRIAY